MTRIQIELDYEAVSLLSDLFDESGVVPQDGFAIAIYDFLAKVSAANARSVSDCPSKFVVRREPGTDLIQVSTVYSKK